MERFKYPRTPHLPYSLSRTDDDKTLETDEQFQGMYVVVTEKMDGENTTIYPDGYIHARSIDGTGYPWQSFLKQDVWNHIQGLSANQRILGENLYAKHSIGYKFDSIEDTFRVFGVAFTSTDGADKMYSWWMVEHLSRILGFKTVPVIYKGTYDKERILNAFNNYCNTLNREVEGFVVRNYEAFNTSNFSKNAAKFVRANHVQTDEHWRDHWVKNEF